MTVNLNIKRTGKYWIANCKQFKTFGYSSVSEADAIEECYKALVIFFEVHLQRGTLKKALKHFL